jgi:PAT family beta-lactamase induction signal transducer AmpG
MGMDNLKIFLSSKRMWVVLLMGFSSGLPFLLTGGTLKLWLAREHVDISTIGYFTAVASAYSLKVFWAPLVDRYKLFFFGRRRSWILLTQILIALGLFQMAALDPHTSLSMMALVAVGIAFFSATQDIAIDAYRREILDDEEMGLGSTLTQYGYRIAMLISGGVGVGIVAEEGQSGLTWNHLYIIMGVCMILMMLVTMWAPEPKGDVHAPKTLTAAVIEPFKDFFSRDRSLFILLFVFLFKLGDAIGGSMLNPFYVEMGYTNPEIALIAKTVGLVASLAGLLIGGLVIFKLGINRSLWIFGILQALATAGFSLITFTGHQIWALGVTVIFEDIAVGMGSAAFIAYLATITNKKFTGTQFALLSAVATSGRNIVSVVAGVMVKELGWAQFFWASALLGIPGLVMLWFIQNHQTSEENQLSEQSRA